MPEEIKRPHLTENFKPEVVMKKNFVPTTTKPDQVIGAHGVEGNYVPPTGSSEPKSPPPKPKK